MILRYNYLEKIKPFIDAPLIKVISGIRRSGKSTVMKMIREELLSRGIPAERIISINFESFTATHLKTAETLYTHIQAQVVSTDKYYILLDEIQDVNGWEQAINAMSVDMNVDLYITGSNSHLLSSELSTYLAGRYVEFSIFTLSFDEFLKFKAYYSPQNQGSKTLFLEYLRKGGFPVIHIGDYDDNTAYKIVQDIYASVILRDTVQRHKIRDIELLERIIKYAFDNIGNTFSGKNISDYLKSQQRKVDVSTVYNYLHALEGAFILHRVERFDLKGKEILKTQEKFYLGDISLLHATLGFKGNLISGMLENIVFLELKRRGYKVYIGKLKHTEIDFIAEKQQDKLYIQVAYKLENQTTIEREFTPLRQVQDHHPKLVITMDELFDGNIDGIKHMHIVEFLKDPPQRIKLGSLLQSIAQEAGGLSDTEIEIFDNIRDKTPAKPIEF